MTVNRGAAASWALGLGILLAFVGGAAVSTETPGEELRYVGAFTALFVAALYGLIVRNWEHWSGTRPSVRFVVVFLGGFAAIAVCTLVVRLLLSGFGAVTTAAEVLAVGTGFGVAAWLCFYGGGERVWAVLVDRLDLEW